MTAAMARNLNNKRALFATLNEAGKSYDILGYTVWWNIRDVEITQDQFAALLRQAGIDEKYAREHIYRSAFIRALHNLEEKRIIRRVDETGSLLTYQFTAEQVVTTDGEKSLEYDKETVIIVDKDVYRRTGDFKKALVQGRDDIKQKVLTFFEQEKTKYYSSDITRYIQKIFQDRADFVNLRPQGCVYFVPARYSEVVQSIKRMVEQLNKLCSLEAMPIVNVESSREVIGGAFTLEMQQVYVNIAAELKAVVDGNKDVGEKWTENKRAEISDLLARVDDYAGVLTEKKKEQMTSAFEALQKQLMPKRVLID
jgi:hypothetical protein